MDTARLFQGVSYPVHVTVGCDQTCQQIAFVSDSFPVAVRVENALLQFVFVLYTVAVTIAVLEAAVAVLARDLAVQAARLVLGEQEATTPYSPKDDRPQTEDRHQTGRTSGAPVPETEGQGGDQGSGHQEDPGDQDPPRPGPRGQPVLPQDVAEAADPHHGRPAHEEPQESDGALHGPHGSAAAPEPTRADQKSRAGAAARLRGGSPTGGRSAMNDQDLRW